MTTDYVAKYLREQKPDDKDMIILEWVRTEFNLPPSIVDQCDMHFLRVWAGEYVNDIVIGGEMHVNGKTWTVHFQSNRSVVTNSDKVACSFRAYRGKHYVVVKVWKGGGK